MVDSKYLRCRFCAISFFYLLRCGVGSEKSKIYCVPEVPSAEQAKWYGTVARRAATRRV